MQKSFAYWIFSHPTVLSQIDLVIPQDDLPQASAPTRYACGPLGGEKQGTGGTTMFTETKIALAAAMIIGAASIVIALEQDQTLFLNEVGKLLDEPH
jgi:hypothetical protein